MAEAASRLSENGVDRFKSAAAAPLPRMQPVQWSKIAVNAASCKFRPRYAV